MPFQNNVLAGASGATGYEIPYSLRFRSSNSPMLSRTAGTPTNSKICTWSFWHKRGKLGGEFVFGEPSAGIRTFFTFDSVAPDTIRIYIRGVNLTSTPVFRDPSAWYHFVVAVDTTQATAADRIKVYANGQVVTMSGTVTLNSDITWNESGRSIYFGNGATWFNDSRDYPDGYLAEINFVDGQQLTPSNFGQTDATTGVWVPKKYAGTYGNNGFYLKFADASAATAAAIGKDSSGNGNNWTPSGISVTSGVTFDQMTDTPTLNYATFNQIDQVGGTNTLTASLDITTSSSVISAALGTFWRSSGKWYWEFVVNGVAGICQIGIAKTPIGTISTNGPYQSANVYTYISNGNKGNNNTSSAYGASYTTNDVIGVALDLDAGTLVFYKNNVSQGTAFSSLSGEFSLIVGDSGNASTISGSLNCGQRAFAYTPPTGFKALNSANLPTPSIKKGSLYMDATLRTGTGATASVSSLGFQPDFVWIKSRSASTNHNLFDSSRGAQKGFNSNASGPEYTDANSLTAFNANGYSLGSDASSRGVNINTNTYVDWAWKEGATPGFDVVTYTGNATNRTISHSLGAVPKMMIIKNVDTAQTPSSVPVVYHSMLNGGVNPANYYMYLTSTAAEGAYAFFFNNTAPTSSVFTVGTDSFVNGNTRSMVAYLWSEIEGFSKFSSYTGNGSTDGPFVWCGFRPRYILFKNATSAGNNWLTFDTARDPYNLTQNKVAANAANSENDVAISGVSENNLDILSNGFKLRTSNAQNNGSGSTIIFAAFAENPFKYSRAR